MEYDNEQINEFIHKLQERKTDIMMQSLSIANMQFNEDDKILSEKLRWYMITLDDILNDPDILSNDERSEFINLHLAYVKKHRSINA